MKRFVVNCSFGGSHGWGHVIRSSALASTFKARGWETVLWSNGDARVLPLDVRRAFDGFETQGQPKGDVLCIDEMYTSQAELELRVAAWRQVNRSGVVMGIDDLQHRSMAGFDVVVNTELGLKDARYESGRALLGESYALLREGFNRPTAFTALGSFPEGVVPTLVMIGGTDPGGYAEQVLSALADWGRDRIAPVVLAERTPVLEEALQGFGHSVLLSRLDASQLAEAMRFCSLAVVACGSSLYELAAMRLPFVGLCVVDNQLSTARCVESQWGMPIAYPVNGRLEAGSFVGSFEQLFARGRSEYSSVDTKGADRVADALLEIVGR